MPDSKPTSIRDKYFRFDFTTWNNFDKCLTSRCCITWTGRNHAINDSSDRSIEPLFRNDVTDFNQLTLKIGYFPQRLLFQF